MAEQLVRGHLDIPGCCSVAPSVPVGGCGALHQAEESWLLIYFRRYCGAHSMLCEAFLACDAMLIRNCNV